MQIVNKFRGITEVDSDIEKYLANSDQLFVESGAPKLPSDPAQPASESSKPGSNSLQDSEGKINLQVIDVDYTQQQGTNSDQVGCDELLVFWCGL